MARSADMEYEIEDEVVLFDESTNPSLLPEKRRGRTVFSFDPADRRKAQKAVLIPEEEQQLS